MRIGPRLLTRIEMNAPNGDIVSPVCKLCLENDESSILKKIGSPSEDWPNVMLVENNKEIANIRIKNIIFMLYFSKLDSHKVYFSHL
jgi:hypothetical protein